MFAGGGNRGVDDPHINRADGDARSHISALPAARLPRAAERHERLAGRRSGIRVSRRLSEGLGRPRVGSTTGTRSAAGATTVAGGAIALTGASGWRSGAMRGARTLAVSGQDTGIGLGFDRRRISGRKALRS